MRLPNRVLAVGVVVLFSLLSGCGGSDDSSSDEEEVTEPVGSDQSDDASAPDAVTASESLNGVRLLELSTVPDPVVSFFAVADELGVFAEHGVEPDILAAGGGGPQKIQALVAGEADVVVTDVVAAIAAINEGADITVVMVPSARYGATIVASQEITDIAELEGQQWGVPSLGGSARFITDILLESVGMSPDDVRYLAVGGTADAFPALETGQVAAATLSPSTVPVVEDMEGFGVLIDSTAAYTPPFPNFVLATRTDMVDDPGVTATITAMIDAARILAEDQDAYVSAVQALVPDTYEDADLERLWSSLTENGFWAVNGGINLEATEAIVERYFEIVDTEPAGVTEAADVYSTGPVETALTELGMVEDAADMPDWR